MRRHVTFFWLAGATLLIAACGGLQPAGSSTAMLLEYQTHPTNYNLADLAKSYANTIKYNSKRDTCQPGLYAEYGVALALLGKNSEANKMFNSEIAAFPNSARYVRQLKLALVPEYVSDTVTDTNTMFDIDLGEYADSAAKEEIAEPSSIERLQARELAKKEREAAKEQQMVAKEKAREERELMKSIREKEKIARDQQREAAKEQREAEKERQQKLKKQQAKERKAAKKEQERLKEQQKAEREAAREAAKIEKERQREALRAAKEAERERAKVEREQAKSQSAKENEEDD